VQKKIWIETGNRLGVKPQDWTNKDFDNYLRFAKTVGWYDDKKLNEAGGSRGDFLRYDDLIERIKDNPSWGMGSLPIRLGMGRGSLIPLPKAGYWLLPLNAPSSLALRLVKCNI
jgi:hypothetical protein